MPEVMRFGAGDNRGKEVAAFEQKAGSPEDVAAVAAMSSDQVRSALALWTAGANYGDIAAQLQFSSPVRARIAIERALSEMVDDTTDRSKLRRKMSLVLERLMRAIMNKAIDPNHPEQLAAVRTTLAIVDRYSKLQGLDAPIEVNHNMPDQEQFNAFIALAASAAGLGVPEEADIFEDIEDAVVVEDEDAEAEG